MKINVISALLVFILAFSLRIPLVDRMYQYSFEPDSEPCVEVTRSFYFFFKSPSPENFPQTLDVYPNYSDGDFIASALIGNIVRPLCKAGIINDHLADSDNSLVIYSMRWGGVLFDAFAAAIAFLVFVLLTGNSFISFIVTLLYYLLNQQTLNIDLIRIDHFGLLAANLTMLAALLLYYYPNKKRYYIFSGIASGLVTGTKINFPFYLLILFVVFCYLVYSKKISFKNFILLALSFLLSCAFMYQRWLMYPEHIWEVIAFTFNNGKVWTGFWGIDNRSYYLWDEFFNHGYSLWVAMLLVFAYASFILCCTVGFIKKDSLRIILCITFILQSIALMFSPKVGRYGIIIPLWMGIFISYGFGFLLQYAGEKNKKAVLQLAFAFFLLPAFCYALNDYVVLRKKSKERDISILQTRIRPYLWVKDNVKAGSVVAYQFTRVSNPPIFEMPLVFESQRLTCPFLYKDKLLSFYPPNADSVKQWANYMVINSKETDFHFFMLNSYYNDTSLSLQWQNFFHRLDTLYPVHDFSSAYANYGLNDVRIYELNKLPYTQAPEINNCSSVVNNAVAFSWQLTNFNTDDSAYNFEVQIAGDSTFQWLISGSRDGFPSRYRANGNPYVLNGPDELTVPPKIAEALIAGSFAAVMHGQNPRLPAVQTGIQRFFRRVLVYMFDNNATMRQAISHFMDKNDVQQFTAIIDSVYGGTCNFLDSGAEDYIKLAALKIDSDALASIKKHNTGFAFKPALPFVNGRKYYWRVRLRNNYMVMSDWSNINAIVI